MGEFLEWTLEFQGISVRGVNYLGEAVAQSSNLARILNFT